MHSPNDAVAILSIPFGSPQSVLLRGSAERYLEMNGIKYIVTQDALLLSPIGQFKSFMRRQTPRLWFLIRQSDYKEARELLLKHPRLQSYLDSTTI